MRLVHTAHLGGTLQRCAKCGRITLPTQRSKFRHRKEGAFQGRLKVLRSWLVLGTVPLDSGLYFAFTGERFTGIVALYWLDSSCSIV